MKATTSYDKSAIMKNAWRHFRCCFGITFGQALKWAWNLAKEEVANAEYNARREAEHKKKYAAYDQRLARESSNVVWGKNDWVWTYGSRRRYY